MIIDAELGPLERQLRVVDDNSAQIADADVILAVGRPAAVARCRRPAAGRLRGGRRASLVRAELPGAPSMTRSAGPTDAPEIRPGHTHVGHARRCPTRVEAAGRRRSHVGDTVVVLGDDVPPFHARVPSVADDDPEVGAEALDDAASRSGPGPVLRRQRRPNGQANVALAPEVGPLTASEIAAHADGDEQVDRWLAGRRVTVPGADGSPRFPSHQLDEAGQPRPVIADIQHALGGELSPWEFELRSLGNDGWLRTKRPADELGGPDEPPVIQAAAGPADEGLA